VVAGGLAHELAGGGVDDAHVQAWTVASTAAAADEGRDPSVLREDAAMPSPLRAARTRRSAGQSSLTATLPGLKAVLDSIEAKVFVADTDFTLVYANRAAVRTARTFEGEFRRVFGVGLADLVGGSIHRFHRDPARIERILRDPANFPHRSFHRFGNVVLEGQINAVTDDAGAVIGYCIAWEDVTAREGVEQRVREVAERLAEASAQLSALGAGLDRHATSTAEQAGVAAAATEQMSSSTRAISASVSSAVTVAEQAVAAAGDSSGRIARLSTSSQEIGSVVQLISSIAAQTNLLALNATIEAARAGEAGKGFAVVASEVKDLAQETAAATQRITDQITALQEDSQRTKTAIDGITELIARISDAQSSVAGAVEKQTATTHQISDNVGGVATTATSTTESVAAMVGAAADLAAKAEELRRLVSREA
jgi:PAS domain-containing protein